MQAQIKLKEMELQLEKCKLEADAAKDRLKEMEFRERQLEREHEIKIKELEIQSRIIDKGESKSGSENEGVSDAESKGNDFLKHLKIMKGVMIDPPSKAEEWPFFFHHAEMMFNLYKIPEEHKGKIILQSLKTKVKSLISTLGERDLDNYTKIKDTVLKEFQITPLQHKRNLEKCVKRYEETYTQHIARVEAALDFYLESRKVKTFDKLRELLIVDQVKDQLPANVKAHSLLKEVENWLSPSELANNLDNYVAAMPRNYNTSAQEVNKMGQKQDLVRQGEKLIRPNKSKGNFSSDYRVDKEKYKGIKTSEPQGMGQANKKVLKCFQCQGEGHIKRFCPAINLIAKPKRGSEKGDTDEAEAKGLNKICVGLKLANYAEEIPLTRASEILPRIDLQIGNARFKGVIDSGAEITVIRKSVVPEKYLESGGKIWLQPAVGPQVEAQLVTVPISIWSGEEDVEPYVNVHTAVVHNLYEEALVTPRDFRLLREQRDIYLGENKEEKLILGVGQEQAECGSLKSAFTDARNNKNGYWLESGILYHTGTINGQRCNQLVVPQSRRKEIVKLVHESLQEGNFAAKKTAERIKMSFWWEGLSKEVRKWCEACKECQLRRKVKGKDRAPITAVGRPELPFQVVNADILGPIEPKSSRGHQYVLCVVDQHSRWPEAIPLKAVTAKATCDAFIDIFMRTGVPRMIAMDNGTNFKAKLTQEFLSKLGASPKFSTPGYPQSNGLVERWIGTTKSMLHHAINTQGRNWDKQLPYLLWAYREIPNSTTGVSPFLLMYGRVPVGPLAILKSSWVDETVLPQGVGESVTEYLISLRNRLQEAEKFAKENSEAKQQKYVHHHNLRSKEMEFEIGDEVVVLIPTSTNKLCSKWTGPGEIVEKKSPHSYLVKLPDESVRHLHQNKLRKYIQPINAVGIIYEADTEFGEVQHAPIERNPKAEKLLDRIIGSDEWKHLDRSQRNQLSRLIKSFHVVFDGEIKCAKVGSHSIRLKPGVERKQPHVYKVPEALKPQVEKQIADLLERGLIEPSTAEITYPIVCVAQRDGSIRLCCDYRGLNAESQIIPFPMQNAEELRYKAGAARYLSTLDILKGYWEIPMEKESRHLTSFVSPKGQYQWKVMPFGLSGAAATFQRVMNQALRPHSDYAESFIDDIIVYSSTWEEHLRHLKAVLSTLQTLNFTANLEKCSFGQSEVKYLGHIVGSGRHGPDPEKLEVIKILKPPRTKKALRSVLGLYNYYREYVPNYAKIARPLTDLTRKSIPNDIPWGSEAEKAFKELKDALCTASSLYTPDIRKPFEINTDASLIGIGACLLQRDEYGKARPITFASQKLTSAQSKWSTIEREAYAIIWALDKFETWTYGNKILLHTENNPLKYLTEGIPRNARLQRWALALSRFQVTLLHKSGAKNSDADALSRIPHE
ncbi:Retrovirus-related Pol polyprotein from transposon 17.6, partial [Stegodyphus mimosarum]